MGSDRFDCRLRVVDNSMIWAITIFAITIIIKLAIDLKRWQSGNVNKHSLGPGIVAGVLITCSYICGWWSVPMWFFGYWALFDTLWGVLAIRDPFYVGETAWLDKLQRKYRVLQVLKYVLAIGSIILYVMTLNK